ncbi:hypothetical protein, partial [Paenibacillus macquariensis]
DPDIDPGVDLAMLRDIGEIVTKHGDFVRVEKQTIFNEPEIARQLNQIGFNTNHSTQKWRMMNC